MKCIVDDCTGKINMDGSVSVQVGCHCSDVAFPCDTCGRLHFLRGDEVHKVPVGVSTRGGKEAFLIDGQIIHR
ncbi:MAG: hypothetical protein WC819_01305 [Parcubacteria group bacterium]|jgi:hypothetical protein